MAGDCSVGTRSQGDMPIAEFGGYRRQKAGSDANVAVAHHQQIVAGFGGPAIEAEDLGVGGGGRAGYDQARRPGREPALPSVDHRNGGDVPTAPREPAPHPALDPPATT